MSETAAQEATAVGTHCHTQMGGKLLGSFLLQEAIGHGTFSTVWRAVDQTTGQHVAVKVVSREKAEGCPNYNVRKEVLIQENLQHRNTVRLVEARRDAGHYYLVMEWAAGGELFEKIGTAPARCLWC